ncbi:hypothetical protein LCGC14_2186250 [marine sediment metagenome]|uniref:Uncharacterized protein n=1 Tax=marine sediment metagenome TaxID=412755 RepID=A0A0F9E7Z6_9ZZZZ
MPHATIKALAKGFLKTATKEVKKARDIIIEEGRSQAVSFVCDAIEAKTGLPSSVCRPVAKNVVQTLSKEIRKKLKP